MRDIIIALVVFGAVPYILTRPHIGVLVWSWLGYMNPHRMAYGFAYSFPFSTVTAIATLAGIVFSSEKKTLPWSGTMVVWILFMIWMNVTTPFALNPAEAMYEWDRTMKTMLMVFITLLVINTHERINALVWIIVLSLGFYGVKGGIFSLATGGNYRIWGPESSFIEDNNSLALALVMTLPLMRYLQLRAKNKYLRWGMLVSILLTAVSILTSFSRGALLASGIMAVFLAWKSQYRLRMFLAMLVLVPTMLAMMPQAWWDRMNTIQTYDKDASAMGRINAWMFAYNLALDRPLVGGGFKAFSQELFYKYAPDPEDHHAAHSIYFQVLGDHGFVGLLLFLLLGGMTLLTGRWVIQHTRDRPDLCWAHDLAGMLQVSAMGYATGGAFLSLAYYDLFYHIMALMIILKYMVRQAIAQEKAPRDRSPRIPAISRSGREVSSDT